MKRDWKKLLGFMLAAAMTVLTLAACSSKEPAEKKSDVTPTVTQAAAEPTEEAQATVAPTEAPKDLNGMEITIGNWWETDPPAPPKTQQEEDTLKYRDDIMAKHNFKIKRVNLGTWMEYQEIMVSSTLSGDPAADVFIMDTSFVAAPLQQGLLYPLNTLENFDFTEEKWNKQVKDLMTVGDNVYGMATGRMEPRLGVFWNKRLFEEAGIDPDLPYDLQAKGEWTWDALKDLAKRNTRDTNGDGVPDVYGISSFNIDFFRGVVFSNNAKFIDRDASGKYINATGEPNFLQAIEWGRSLYDEGYHMPQPEGSNWDWFISTFHDGLVAMQCAEEYKVNTWADMKDDWGFVIFPKGPQGEMMTVFNENIVVMPAGLEKEKAENIAYAYNLYTEPTPGYEDVDWKAPYYAVFRDSRAVDETLPLFYEPQHATMNMLTLVSGLNMGDITYGVDAGSETPAEAVEKVQLSWQASIDAANGIK